MDDSDMVVTFQYRLYPTREQQVVLDTTVETCRRLYNGALAERIEAYQYEGRTIGIAIRLHHPLQGTPKTCTVSRKAVSGE